ncbi:hypothetical protein, partial [Alteromonas flava]|uniref:hypothetical protein n=1 Tax=Alteromonas flava TaxID=2048003 RepID=UPI00196A7514
MNLDTLLRGLIILPGAVVFIWCLVNIAKNFSEALRFCEKPFLVRTLPFLFLSNTYFSEEGVALKNRGFKW